MIRLPSLTRTNAQKEGGFTLIEMLTAIVVSTLLFILIMTFLTNTLVKNTINSARADLLREAQLTLDSMSSDIRLSANVDAENRWPDDNSPNAVEANGHGWESDGDTLILAIAAVDSTRNILFDDPLHYVTYKNNQVYFVENGTLYRRVIAGEVTNNAAVTSCPAEVASSECPADRELVKNVTNFSIRYLNSLDEEVTPGEARSVELTLGLEVEKYGRQIAAEYVTRTVFRNE